MKLKEFEIDNIVDLLEVTWFYFLIALHAVCADVSGSLWEPMVL